MTQTRAVWDCHGMHTLGWLTWGQCAYLPVPWSVLQEVLGTERRPDHSHPSASVHQVFDLGAKAFSMVFMKSKTKLPSAGPVLLGLEPAVTKRSN